MKKQSKQLMVLLLVLVFLIAGYFGLQQYNKAQSQKEQEDTSITLIDVKRDDIVSFSYNYEGVTYSFEKKEDTWYYTEDSSINLNQNRILAMLNRVSPLLAEQEIANVTDMAQYGFDEPTKVIQFETETASYTIEAGIFNSLTSIYYVRIPSESAVYTVNASVVTTFDRDLEDLKVAE